MNRAERRKQGKSAPKPKTYVLTQDQIDQIKKEAADEAFKLLIAVPATVLHDKFGFGRIRLDRFFHYMFGWVEDIQNGIVSIHDVLEICEKEAGITIQTKGRKK